MKNVSGKSALFVFLAALLCFALSLSSCDSILFTGYQGPQGEKGDKGDKGEKGPPGSATSPAETPTGPTAPPTTVTQGKSPGPEIDPRWAVSLISRDKHEFTIADNAAPAHDTGQGVEYSVSLDARNPTARSAAPTQNWIGGSGGEVTFLGLDPDTDYYVWARAKENAYYEQGPAKADVGGMVTTKPLREDPFAFTSLSGERNAMYYLEPDPVDPNKKINLSASHTSSEFVAGVSYGLPAHNYEGGTMTFENQITLLNFPLRNLIASTPTSVTASGLCAAIYYKQQVGNLVDFRLISSSTYFDYFGGEKFESLKNTAFTASSRVIDYTKNSYPAPETFSSYNGDLALPITREYSSALRVNRDITFSVPVSRATFESLANSDLPKKNNSLNLSFVLRERKGADLVPTATVNERHKLSSAGFYQYLALVVEYPPDISVFNIAAAPIVESFSYDAEANTIAVTFKSYASPYEGTVLTYTLVTEDGKQKVMTMEIK
jgi:hypothetical protein